MYKNVSYSRKNLIKITNMDGSKVIVLLFCFPLCLKSLWIPAPVLSVCPHKIHRITIISQENTDTSTAELIATVRNTNSSKMLNYLNDALNMLSQKEFSDLVLVHNKVGRGQG